MPLYLQSKRKPELAFEVLDYDSAAHTAILRNRHGIVTDRNFHLYMVRRVYDLVQDKPEGVSDATEYAEPADD
jgi:hypothetical protein